MSKECAQNTLNIISLLATKFRAFYLCLSEEYKGGKAFLRQQTAQY